MQIAKYILKLAVLALVGTSGLAAAETFSFNMGSNFSLLGSVNAPTEPVPLQVVLDAPVATDTFIQIVSSDPSILIVSGGGATVPAGQLSSAVLLSGLQLGNANLTASFAGAGAVASVSVVTQIPTVPEASTLALLSMGSLVVLGAARRHRRPLI
ncbi:PEP-CTERM sorting domain-containing protein [Roseateles sp. NT4]|uniref:PEP-CTERM sorting domain-containing protein n=1 Tax=Roseateles sp. NT4 TaxID=3453715 RepID=UPI003EEE8BEE